MPTAFDSNTDDVATGGEEAASTGVDWAALTNDMQSDAPDHFAAETTEAKADEAPAAPVATEAPKPAEPPPVQQTQAAQETPPAPPKPAETVQQPTQQVAEPKKDEVELPQVTPRPEVKVDDFVKSQEAFIAEAAKQYEMTDEQVSQYLTEPNKVLPNLAARVQEAVTRQTMQAVAQMIQQILPQFLEHHLSVRESTNKAQDMFYGQWPELKAHKDRVTQIATVYRQLNPNVDANKFMQDVGIQAWMALGLPVAGLAGKLQGVSAPSPAPGPAPAQAPVGLVPANPNGRPPAAPTQPSNPWSVLAEEIIQTERF